MNSINEITAETCTGTDISYYLICKTKLWLYSRKIMLEDESEYVRIGRTVDELSYKRGRKNVAVDSQRLDLLTKGNTLEAHEIKKSRAMEYAHIWQLKHYLSELSRRGIDATGFIDYPLENRHLKISLDEEDEMWLRRAAHEIAEIKKGGMPFPEHKPYCTKCAYFEFCWGGDTDQT